MNVRAAGAGSAVNVWVWGVGCGVAQKPPFSIYYHCTPSSTSLPGYLFVQVLLDEKVLQEPFLVDSDWATMPSNKAG